MTKLNLIWRNVYVMKMMTRNKTAKNKNEGVINRDTKENEKETNGDNLEKVMY